MKEENSPKTDARPFRRCRCGHPPIGRPIQRYRDRGWLAMRKGFRQLRTRHKVLLISATLLTGSGMVLGAVRLGRRTPAVPTFEVKRGEFTDSLQFRGEVKALKSVTLSAPAEAGDLQIIKLSPEGAAVKPGDVVVEFDRTKTEQDLAQYRSALKSAEATIEQARAAAKLAEEEDKTAVLKARFEVEGARLEASKKKIVPRSEGKKPKLTLPGAEQKLREAETKQKPDPPLSHATIKSAVQASAKARYDVQRAERALGQMSVRAPSTGIISILEHWAGSNMQPYRTGDKDSPGGATQ